MVLKNTTNVKLMRTLDSNFEADNVSSEWVEVREHLPVAIAEFDELGSYLSCNLCMQGLTGLVAEDMGPFFNDQIDLIKVSPTFCEILSDSMEKKSRTTFQMSLESDGNQSRLLMGVIIARKKQSGAVGGYLLTLIDVSSERDLRSEVRFQQSLLKSLLTETKDIVLEVCRAPGVSRMRSHVPLEWNWGTNEFKTPYESLRLKIHPSDIKKFDLMLISLTNHKLPAAKLRARLEIAPGEYKSYSVSISEMLPGAVKSFIIVFKEHNDVVEPARSKKNEVACIGHEEICGFISHEIKNMLLLIQMEASRGIKVMTSPEKNPERATKALRSIYRANERITALIKALENFRDEKEIVDKEEINLKNLLEEFIRFIGKYLKMSDVRVLLDCSDGIKLNTNSILLQVILMNLFKNAMEAMSETEGRMISVKATMLAGKIVLTFEDNGPGISPDFAAKIFEAGSSTKGCGRGTGLYLSSLIVKKMGGELRLTSNRPTRFEIDIPNVSN